MTARCSQRGLYLRPLRDRLEHRAERQRLVQSPSNRTPFTKKVGALIDPRVYEALRQVVRSRKALNFIDDVHG